MRNTEGRGERVREALRTAAAKALAGTAQGLGAAAKAAASTASQLRPPPPAEPPRSPAPPPAASSPSAGAPPSAAAGGPAATEPGKAAEVPPPSTAREQRADTGPDAQDGAVDVAALADMNARELVAEVRNLEADDLRRLRSQERSGKSRKTVLAAIDDALGK